MANTPGNNMLTTIETARLMITRVHANLLATKELTVGTIGKLTTQCFTHKGAPLELAKPKKDKSEGKRHKIDDFCKKNVNYEL